MTTVRRFPWLTVGVLTLTAAASVVGLLDHTVLHHLERRAGELGDGEPWRLVTSLLVHDSWPALLANLILLGLVGVAVERRRSHVEWIVLYLAGGLVGQLVGVSWQPHGAGNSVAVLGVAGALVVDAIRRRGTPLIPLGYTVIVMVTLMAGDVGGAAGVVIVVLACLVPGATIAATRQHGTIPPQLEPGLGWAALGVAAILVALANIHGPALLVGTAVALTWRDGVVRTPA